jgi:hypothetical protein
MSGTPSDRQKLRFSLPSIRKQQQIQPDLNNLYQKSNALINHALLRAQSTPHVQQNMSPAVSRAILIPNPFL